MARPITALPELEYGLLGRKLGHSWSPTIHTKLGSAPYELLELAPDEVELFVRQGTWKGLNVTMPYKPDAARVADVQSDRVKRLGVSNTLIRQADGSILAENTDVLGFALMLNRFCEREFNATPTEAFGEASKVLVLGKGGASAAVHCALEDAGLANIVHVDLEGDETYETLVERHADAVLLVNCTPAGMYPACPGSALKYGEMEQLSSLKAVLDVVYNPHRTGICLAAEKLGIPWESGMVMLVAQAVASSQMWRGIEYPAETTDAIIAELVRSCDNVILIGMPGSGKTGAGRRLAHLTHRPFVDIDDAIELELGCSIPEYFAAEGEEAFRKVETHVTGRTCAGSGLVVACGGGVVTRPENYDLLHQNGTIVMLDRPLEELATDGRPVSQSKGVVRIAEERMPLYRGWADLVLPCTGSAAGDARAIQELLGL